MTNSTIKSNSVPSVRDSNIELYRVITMFLILTGHYVFNSGLLVEIWGNLSAKSLFFYSMGIWGKTGINGFVLITGYYMCTSKITIRKFIKLLLQIEFYKIIISTVFLFVKYSGYSLNDYIFDLLPIRSISTDFVGCFLLFYLLIPFYNIALKGLSKEMHSKLIMLLLFIYSIMIYVPKSHVDFNYVSWFTVLYFVGSYIRLHPEGIYKSDNVKIWGVLTAISILLSLLSVISIIALNKYCSTSTHPFVFVLDSNALLAFLTGVTSFMFFKNLKMRYSKIINLIASTTFGILLIHANSDVMRNWLWIDIVDCVGHYNISHYALYFIGSSICIYLVCSVIDWIRISTLEKWIFNHLDKTRFFLVNN